MPYHYFRVHRRARPRAAAPLLLLVAALGTGRTAEERREACVIYVSRLTTDDADVLDITWLSSFGGPSVCPVWVFFHLLVEGFFSQHASCILWTVALWKNIKHPTLTRHPVCLILFQSFRWWTKASLEFQSLWLPSSQCLLPPTLVSMILPFFRDLTVAELTVMISAEATAPHRRFSVRTLFSSTRHIFYVVLFTLWICIDIALLGLVSEQIHKYGRYRENYPTAQYQNALGLLLFSTIIGLLFGIFHWALGLTMYLPIFLAFGVWFGTGAGILEPTPFGHGFQCRHTWDLSRFPANWQPYVGECSRVTAIEGLAWAMCTFLDF